MSEIYFQSFYHVYAFVFTRTATFVHLDLLIENEVKRVVLAFFVEVHDFLFIFATLNVEDKFFGNKLVSFIEWAGGCL